MDITASFYVGENQEEKISDGASIHGSIQNLRNSLIKKLTPKNIVLIMTVKIWKIICSDKVQNSHIELCIL